MPAQSHEQSLERRNQQRQLWKVGLSLLLAALVVPFAPGCSAALDHLAPQVPNHPQGAGTRIARYLRSGQLKADALTLAAAVRYLMESEGDAPIHKIDYTLSKAENANPSLPGT